MTKRGEDYIPYDCEIEEARAAARARAENATDPRKKYIATYTLLGAKRTEDVYAVDIKTAEQHVRQQLGMIGFNPTDLVVTVA